MPAEKNMTQLALYFDLSFSPWGIL